MQRNNLDFCKEILLPVFLGIWDPHFLPDLEMLTLRLMYHLLLNFIERTSSATVKRRIGPLNSASWKQQQVVAVLFSCVRLFVTSWTAACQASLSFTTSQTHVHWVKDATQPSHLLLSPSRLLVGTLANWKHPPAQFKGTGVALLLLGGTSMMAETSNFKKENWKPGNFMNYRFWNIKEWQIFKTLCSKANMSSLGLSQALGHHFKTFGFNFPVVQWLGLPALTAEGLDSIPCQGTKISQAVWFLFQSIVLHLCHSLKSPVKVFSPPTVWKLSLKKGV